MTQESRYAEGVSAAAWNVVAGSSPETLRKRHYEAGRSRFGYPPYYLATMSQIEEVLTCLGCKVRDVRGVRVVDVIPGCPAHDRPVAA